jgi:hypothetical protein
MGGNISRYMFFVSCKKLRLNSKLSIRRLSVKKRLCTDGRDKRSIYLPEAYV